MKKLRITRLKIGLFLIVLLPAISVGVCYANKGCDLSDSGNLISFHREDHRGLFSQSLHRDLYIADVDSGCVIRLTDSGSSHHAEWSPDGTRLAFSASGSIYIRYMDGGETTHLAEGTDPVWSPDGTKLVFSSLPMLLAGVKPNIRSPLDIYVMNADGNDITPLSSTGRFHGDIYWSPDGTRIAFYSSPDGGPGEKVYLMDPDGSGVTPLTNNEYDGALEWSPTGTHLAIYTSHLGREGLVILDANGEDANFVSGRARYGPNFDWSPDGSRLALVMAPVDFYTGNDEIYVVNNDGTSLTRLTRNRTGDRSPAWSPDGNRIAFISSRDDLSHISIINADGSGFVDLTSTLIDGYIRTLKWSPDGTQIAFEIRYDSNPDPSTNYPDVAIFVIDANGGELTNVTDHHEDDTAPFWRPK